MTIEPQDVNPFSASSLMFIDYNQADAQVSPLLTDPLQMGAAGFYGRKNSGKTALLQHFQSSAPANTLMVYFAVDPSLVTSEAKFLQKLGSLSLQETLHQGYLSGASLNDVELDGLEDYRIWMRDECLPQIYRAIRSHRRLVWLIDDIEHLINAVEEDMLRSDIFDFLRSLLNQQLGAIATLDIEYDDRTKDLFPLIEPTHFYRIGYLSTDEISRILKPYLAISDEAEQLVLQNTGFEPYLLQQMANALYTQYGTQQIDTAAVRAVLPDVLSASEEEFNRRWNILTAHDQQVLAAVAHLTYEQPATQITPTSVETWLVETEYPMDQTAIAASLRSLEYDELVRHTDGSAHTSSLLLQRWLMARDITLPVRSSEQNMALPITINRRLIIAGIILLATVTLIVLLITANSQERSVTPIPTVTLVND